MSSRRRANRGRRLGAVIAATLALPALAEPGVAHATLSWSTPETISPAGAAWPVVRRGPLNMDAQGRILVVWSQTDEEGRHTVRYRWRSALGKWDSQRTLPVDKLTRGFDITMTPLGEATVAWIDERGRVVVATGRPNRALDEPEVVSDQERDPLGPVLAASDSGEALLGWGDRDRMRIATRSVGGRWGSPRTVADQTTGGPPRIAVNSAGAAAVAWATSIGGIGYVSYRPPGGSFGPPERVPGAEAAFPDVTLNELGETVVASNAITGPTPVGSVELAIRSPLGEWEGPVPLDPGGRATQLMAEPTGAISVLGQAEDGEGGRQVTFATRLPGGTIIGPSAISGKNACAANAAMDLRGTILATWCRNFHPQAQGTTIAFAERLPGRGFSVETVVSGPNSIGSLAALNDAGRAAVAWMRVPTGAPTKPVIQVTVREETGVPPLPLPPIIDILPPVDVSLGDDGRLDVAVRCSASCTARPAGILFTRSRVGEAAAQGEGRRIRRRARRRVRVRFNADAARAAREALRAGRHPWVSVSVTAKGRSARPITVSRRVRLKR